MSRLTFLCADVQFQLHLMVYFILFFFFTDLCLWLRQKLIEYMYIDLFLGFRDGSWDSDFSLGHGFCIWGGGLDWDVLEIYASSNILWEIKEIGNLSLIFILTCLQFFPLCIPPFRWQENSVYVGFKDYKQIVKELPVPCCDVLSFIYSFIHPRNFLQICHVSDIDHLCCVA